MADDEAALVLAARAGDLDAFAVLVDRYRRRALRVAYTIAGDDAEDAVQEAFVKAHRHLGRFDTAAPFAPWLLRIVANEARNRRRGWNRRNRIELRLASRRGDDGASPEDAALRDEERTALAAAVSRLPERDRAVIALRFFAGLSEAEAAQALGVPVGTVKSRLSRALDRLRSELGEEVRL
jgi:RNA polymerase sigma factor (sigma-70 family)